MAAPKTLEELATLASITLDDLKAFEPADFEELTKELGLPVTAKVKLRGLHKTLLANAAGKAEAERKQAEEEGRQAAVRVQQNHFTAGLNPSRVSPSVSGCPG